MIQDKDLDMLLESYPVAEPQDENLFMEQLQHRLDAIDFAKAYHKAEMQKARSRAFWAFAVGIAAGLIMTIIAIAMPSPIELLAFGIRSHTMLLIMEYLPYVFMFLCAIILCYGIIEWNNNQGSETYKSMLLERLERLAN